MVSGFHLIGTNFKHAGLENIARVHWGENDQLALFLKQLRRDLDLEEIFLLQTCNRREFYIYGPGIRLSPEAFRERFVGALTESLGTGFRQEDFFHIRDVDVVRHLFRVASSLESMVLGETEIIRQIKDQAAQAQKDGNLGRRLKALVEMSIWASKQVRSQTNITKNIVSMASLIFRQVMDHVGSGKGNRVVFVGAGHFIQTILPVFSKATQLEFILVNRSFPRDLAGQYGATPMTLDAFLAQPPEFDALVTATGSATSLFERSWCRKLDRPVLILDAGLPRDVDPEVGSLDHIAYMDLVEMETTLKRNRSAREAEIPKTEPIFQEAFEKLHALWLECDLSSYNQQISCHYHEAGEKALSHLFREQLPGLSSHQEEELRDWTRSLVGKLTNIPILGLKGVAKDLGTPAVDAYTRQVSAKSNLFKS